jgi:hypothetical protein
MVLAVVALRLWHRAILTPLSFADRRHLKSIDAPPANNLAFSGGI